LTAPYLPHAAILASKAERKSEKAPIYGAFAEPSDGLEPSTPPYHGTSQATGGSRRQRISLVWAASAPI